jgi:hypothetical protein
LECVLAPGARTFAEMLRAARADTAQQAADELRRTERTTVAVPVEPRKAVADEVGGFVVDTGAQPARVTRVCLISLLERASSSYPSAIMRSE